MQDDNNRTQQLVLEHDDMLRLALLYLSSRLHDIGFGFFHEDKLL